MKSFIDITDCWAYDGWQDTSYRNAYTFIDLFGGAGGLSCGMTMAGFTPITSIEILDSAVETYNYNFTTLKGIHKNFINSKDIRDDKAKDELYNYVKDKKVDLIVGGFPCQGFSMAGKRLVLDERNSLYLEMLKIVDAIKPNYIMMENVLGILSMCKGMVVKRIVEDFKDIGYDIDFLTLNSADYGVAQMRKRVIFIGNRDGYINYYPHPILNKGNYVTLGECIGKYMNMSENKDINHIFTTHTKEMQERLMQVEEGKSLFKDYSDAYRKPYWNAPSLTIKENHGSVNIHPKLPRVLTPREMASLQSFPDDFIFKGSKKWQLVQIGNAVPPLLGKAVGISIMKALNEMNTVDITEF